MAKRPKTQPLLSAAEARLWQERLAAVGKQDVETYQHAFGDLWNRTRHMLEAAMAASAGLAGATDLLEPILAQTRDEYSHDGGRRELAVLGALALARKEPALRERVVAALGACADDTVQHPLALFLDATRPEERGVLERLAGSASERVRSRAKHVLEKAGDFPWWRPAFAVDPLAGLAPEGAAGVEAEARGYLALLHEESSSNNEKHEREVIAQLLRLPRPAALAAIRLLLGTRSMSAERVGDALAGVLTSVEDARLLIEALGTEDRGLAGWVERAVEKAWPRLPEELRRAVVRGCLERARAAPPEEHASYGFPAFRWMSLVGKQWPEGEDATALVELLCLLGESGIASVYAETYLSGAVTRHLSDVARGREVTRAWLENPAERRLRFLFYAPGKHTAQWPVEEQLTLARAFLDRPLHENAARWVVTTLEALAPEEIDARWHDPHLRRAIFALGHSPRLLARARQELRAGVLAPREALEVLGHINGHWGDDVWRTSVTYLAEDPRKDPRTLRPRRADRETQEEQRALATLLGPELAGPVTKAEWAEVRRLRRPLGPAELLAEGHGATVYPLGPWHPDDLADFSRAARHAIAVKDDRAAGCLAHVARFKPEPALLPLVRELGTVALTEHHRRWWKDALVSLEHRYGNTPADVAGAAEGPAARASGDDDW